MVTEWPPIGKIAAYSAYDMVSWYKYLIVNLVFSHLCFWRGNLFLVPPFPNRCLFVPFYVAHCATLTHLTIVYFISPWYVVNKASPAGHLYLKFLLKPYLTNEFAHKYHVGESIVILGAS